MSFFRRSNHHAEDLDDENANIDDDLRLRTVRTAASTLAESILTEERAERRRRRRKRSRFFKKSSDKEKDREKRPSTAASTDDVSLAPSSATTDAPRSAVIPGVRRNIYVNTPLTAIEVDRHGEPLVRYVRNKVRTSKYTPVTFLPRNLFEQFRRIANLYFLFLVVVQVIPIFGATTPQLAALPLIFIIFVTAVKDAVEDYRRAQVDEELNTTATTKLGGWKNVNQPTDPRNWFERLFGLNAPGRVTKGVRKLREKDAGEGMRVVLRRADGTGIGSGDDTSTYQDAQSAASIDRDRPLGAGGRVLDDIQSVDSHTHSYPPGISDPVSSVSLGGAAQQVMGEPAYASSGLDGSTLGSAPPGSGSGSGSGVINWAKRTAGTAQWERTLWKKLEVGDIVLLRENEQVPADIVVLSTADADGMCYVETKNLDGETNLKPRKAVAATCGILSEEDVERSAFVLDSEPPHANLYLYNGVLRFRDARTGEQRAESVTINEMLLRGCALRNTAWVIALVVFTGPDTKIMLNGGDTPSKRSRIEKETNFNVVVNFVLLLCMCIVAAVVFGIYDAQTGTSAFYFEQGSDPTSSTVLNALVTFVSCLIAFQNIVPISLYISIEIVKTIQAYFIAQDIDMYYEPLDQNCVPKTWNISDDLGQIEYIFSDKTGTLTQNVMEFQKCSVGGVTYGEAITEAQRGAARREGRTDLADPEEHARRLAMLREDMLQIMGRAFKNRYQQPENITLVSAKLAEDMADRTSPQRARIADFFRALAVCHTVLADRPEPARDPHHLVYKAESPDEAALVAAARDAGFPFLGRTREGIDIEVMGSPERHVPLRVLEFNSTRKRMSVVARDPQGRIILYCKGADSVIYERLAPDHDPVLKDKTARDMEAFANGGLRTLCIAAREMSEEEYLTWARAYDAAASSVKDRDEALEKACAMVEHSLRILGATALEDKLQEGVPDAIETLHQAGIKLWILTGDKVQTAIEIAFSCNLLKSDMEIMILSADTLDGARTQIEGGLNKMASLLGPPSFRAKDRGFFPNSKASFAVVIDGDTLRYALDPALKELFLALGTQCETVVCCRVSPAQKALTVKLVKDGRKAMTLAIGDGANDVAMIQEANIGVGLFGHEGSQAAMSADYAFGQFRFLTKLLIVHGRWSYRRVAAMHSNFFYKNVIWTFAGFWFLIFNGFSATYLYQNTFVLLYNLVFTSLPVIVLGAFDQDVNAKAALAFPQLYIRGIRGLEYTALKFWAYMADGFYQSAVVFFLPWAVWTIALPSSYSGRTLDSLADFGTTVSVAAIFAANTYVGIDTHYWMVISWIVIVGSSVVMLLWILVYSFFQSSDFVYEVEILFSSMLFWGTWILAMGVALLPRYIVKAVSSAYYPTDSDIVREMWVHGDLKDRLGIQHRRDKRKLSAPGADLEHTPMFQKPHSRSASEMSFNDDRGYMPANTSSPGQAFHQPKKVATYLDTPPQTDAHPTPSASPSPYMAETDALTATRPGARFPVMARSPQPSYYSASEIPSPSPLPAPVYRHPQEAYSSGEPWDHSRAQGTTLQVPPNAYEMRVRTPVEYMAPQRRSDEQQQYAYAQPSHGHEREQPSAASDRTYATAQEDPHVQQEEWEAHVKHGAPPSSWRAAHEPGRDEEEEDPEHWRASSYSVSGPHAM